MSPGSTSYTTVFAATVVESECGFKNPAPLLIPLVFCFAIIQPSTHQAAVRSGPRAAWWPETMFAASEVPDALLPNQRFRLLFSRVSADLRFRKLFRVHFSLYAPGFR